MKEKNMKLRYMSYFLILFLLMVPCNAFAGPKGKQIASVDCVKRIMGRSDKIKVIRIQDPDNPFVAIFFTTIKSGQWTALADPSNTSIAARLIAPIPIKDGKRQIDTRSVDNIASISKSIGSKVMKIGRYYDEEMDTLCYLIYTTKYIDGSLKHNLSVVPLGMPLGFK
jgi:CreA protein